MASQPSQAQEIRRLTFLLGLTERLQSVTSVETIGQYALKYLVENMGAAFGDIKLISGEGHQRCASMLINGMSSKFVATHGQAIAGMENYLNEGIPYGQGLLWEVVETGQPLFIADYASHPKAVPTFRHPSIGQLGIFPIKDQQSRILAVLTLESRTEAPLEEAPQQDILVAACQILGAAIERAQAQEKLKQTNAKLEKISRLKSEFLASMSHELRTPLNSVIGFADLLRRQAAAQLSDRQNNYLKTIEKSGQHLLSLINDILDLSKIEAGKTELEVSLVDVAELFDECLAMMQPRISAKKLQLHINLDPQVKQAHFDRRKVQQILVNLLSNAVKFTPKRGSITLSARLAYGAELRQEKRTDVSLIEESTPYLCLEVTDTGIGISPADQAQLFQSFFQIDGALTRQYEGTGLGLVLTKRLAELHGGTASVESTKGVGSSFRVWLPLTLRDSTRAANNDRQQVLFSPNTEAVTPSVNTDQKYILVVEDQPFNQTLIAEILEMRDYRVEIVAEGQAMLERLQEPVLAPDSLPDLVLMDIQLPQVDGFTLTKALKDNSHWQQIPVIAITALAMAGDRERCLAAGADDYLSKPLQIKALEEKLEFFLHHREKN